MNLRQASQALTNIIDQQVGNPITYGELMKQAKPIDDQLGFEAVASLFEQLLNKGEIIQVIKNKDLGIYGYLLPY